MTHTMPATAPVADAFDAAGNLACFLTVNAGSCFATWTGRLSAGEQRALVGAYRFGRALLTIDGSRETIRESRKVCFGTDVDTKTTHWRDL